MADFKKFTKKIAFTEHAAAVYTLQFDGRYIYSGSADKYVVRWDIQTGKQDKFAIQLPLTPYCIQLVDNNTKLAVGLTNGDVHLFDLNERKEIKYIKLHTNGVFSMAENKSKHHLYISDGEGLVSVWNSQKLELLIQLPFDSDKIRKIVVSDDDTLLYLCCKDGFIRIIDTEYFNLKEEFYAHEDGVGTLIEWDKDTLITGGKDAMIRVWDKSTRKQIKALPAHNYMIYSLIKLDNNTLISSSRDKSIKIWNWKDKSVLQKIEYKHGGHRHSVNNLTKLDDHTFVSASDDSNIIVWQREG
ncbi:MAG: WD40 repeat domain-containing protein [Crocinitomicaceae bacterium]|nr:WD40 repeat domain-containing protein [Crocinitomicaceae bacterium]